MKEHQENVQLKIFLGSLSPKQSPNITWTLNLMEDLLPLSSEYFKKCVNTDSI